jgi:glycosyltransferase involved in cell wall biosynthesis
MNLTASLSRTVHVPRSLAGVPIVCFAHDFEGDPTSKTHIMRLLAKGGSRVLWVNSIGLRRPAVSRGDARRLLDKLKRSVRGCREVEPNLFVTSPLALPLHGIAVADRFNRALLGSTLRRLCRRLGLERPILWTFMPNVGGLLGACRERLVVYHCVDEYTAFSGVAKTAIAPMEEDLTRKAAVVFTSSERLKDERRTWNPNVHFVPHGVDLDHFARALDPSLPIPADLRDVPGPIVGFFGLIADWVDLDLVRAAALARPQWSFVLIGKVATSAAEALGGVPNVRLLGQKPYSALPAYCRGMDVGIIPFRTSALTVRANPLKLREYLAAGLPVVSTPLPEVARYEGLVRLAPDLGAFLAAVEAGLESRSAEADRARAEAMRGESWEERVRDMERIIALRMGGER